MRGNVGAELSKVIGWKIFFQFDKKIYLILHYFEIFGHNLIKSGTKNGSYQKIPPDKKYFSSIKRQDIP